MQLNIAYDLLPKRRTTRTSVVMDHFGIDFETGRHVIVDDLELPVTAGDVVLLTGASGSGKSSLLRGVVESLRHASRVLNIDGLDLGEQTLVDALPLPVEEALRLLSACGLGEAQLMLRTPAELSDGQRYRFRLALGLARLMTDVSLPEATSTPSGLSCQHCLRQAVPTADSASCRAANSGTTVWLASDEFTATLDRTLAQVVAFNVRRLADRTGVGFLLATTHEDITGDLAPEVHVRCRLEGKIEVITQPRPGRQPGETRFLGETGFLPDARRISFFDELEIRQGTKRDWPYFARWHYRSAHVGFVRGVQLLWRGDERIGICVFVSPPTSLKARNRYFGRSGTWERTSLQALNRQLVQLSRVVLHPTYRGAGIGSWFVRECCERSGYRWVETLAQMGQIHPLFERAGFVRVGTAPPPRQRTRRQHSALYGNRVSEQTFRKSRQARPVYYVWERK